VKYTKIDPPGTFCNYEALRDLIKQINPKTFVDVGCEGGISKLLCSMGMIGVGIDFSQLAIEATRKNLEKEIGAGAYSLIEADATSLNCKTLSADMALSFMAMEHVEDDVAFVRILSGLVRQGGHLAICVPGRRDCWSFEDETVGDLRRYDRDDLANVLRAGGLTDVEVWSVAVPTGNLLLHLSDWVVRRSGEAKKVTLSQREQTETSGLREIPWKTAFPSWFKLILKRYTLYPLYPIQRLFYRTGLGITMLGFGRVPDPIVTT